MFLRLKRLDCFDFDSINAIRAGALNQFLANPLGFTNVFTSLVDRKTKNAKHSINTADIDVVVVAFIMTTFMMFLLLFASFQFNSFNSCAVWCEWEKFMMKKLIQFAAFGILAHFSNGSASVVKNIYKNHRKINVSRPPLTFGCE